jgi:hypothetical protein
MKYPPFGKELASRLKFNNPPFHVVVTVGADCWNRAKTWQKCPNDVHALVLPDGDNPNAYTWPVNGLVVVIDVDIGPSDGQLRQLSACLLYGGAEAITVVPRDGLNTFKQYVLDRVEVAA